MKTIMKLPSYETLNIQAFSNMLDSKYLQNSYKLYWFYAIFEEIKKGNNEISFRKLVYRMIAKSWYSLIEYKLNFGWIDQLNKIVVYLHKEYNFEKDISEEKLIEALSNLEDSSFEKFTSDLFKFVPYRLLSPFYPELTGIKDGIKNKKITELSLASNKAIYKILVTEQKIIINDNWFKYIYKNQVIIEGWILNKLIYFLQKRNPNTPAIPLKIQAPQKRNLREATKYWKKIIAINNIRDIYTGEPLTDSLSIDHFIPWSFVLHDEVWNLIPTTRTINSSKNDKLPELDKYLYDYCELQYTGLQTALKHNFSGKLIEDDMTVINGFELNVGIKKSKFIENLRNTVIPIHQIAYNQGFMLWENSIR